MREDQYTFSIETEIDYIENCSRICNVGYFEENEFVKFYGSLLRLFGKPQYSSEDFEASFDYIIKAKSTQGEELLLSAYSGPTGPAIGGTSGIEETHAAVVELISLIKNTAPENYDYTGYYLEAGIRINCGIKDGKVYYQEEEISQEEQERMLEEL
ncbi:MAG: hypothetical protein Q4F05_14945 [bacterium]|nr:hypothetical protein [bacterium]